MNFPMRRQSERISRSSSELHTQVSRIIVLSGCTNTPHTIFDELAHTPAQEYMLKEGMEKRQEKQECFSRTHLSLKLWEIIQRIQSVGFFLCSHKRDDDEYRVVSVSRYITEWRRASSHTCRSLVSN